MVVASWLSHYIPSRLPTGDVQKVTDTGNLLETRKSLSTPAATPSTLTSVPTKLIARVYLQPGKLGQLS